MTIDDTFEKMSGNHNFDHCIGKRIFNSSGCDAGKIVRIGSYECIQCFVVDETTSPYYRSQDSHLGRYWETSRLNEEIWIGDNLEAVVDSIIAKSQQLPDKHKREAQLELINTAIAKQKR